MVVLIIGLLVSILLPSLLQARLLAKRVACMVNLKAVGSAASVYQVEHRGWVPVCFRNFDAKYPNPWKCWRVRLLAYAPGYRAFNCPAGRDTPELGEVFHSEAELRSDEREGTANAGSYGIMHQWSLPSFETENHLGEVMRGNPSLSNAFPTEPGVAWADPAGSVYVADSAMCKGPLEYPTKSHYGYGTSFINPPSAPGYSATGVSRRFADRHAGTNCLFLDQSVVSYETSVLDGMEAGEPGCVWDVE